jgi:hypothetical protein
MGLYSSFKTVVFWHQNGAVNEACFLCIRPHYQVLALDRLLSILGRLGDILVNDNHSSAATEETTRSDRQVDMVPCHKESRVSKRCSGAPQPNGLRRSRTSPFNSIKNTLSAESVPSQGPRGVIAGGIEKPLRGPD